MYVHCQYLMPYTCVARDRRQMIKKILLFPNDPMAPTNICANSFYGSWKSDTNDYNN